jgi:hypothetical protein
MFLNFLPIFIGFSLNQEECELSNNIFGWNILQYSSIHYVHSYNLPESIFGTTKTLKRDEIPLIILDKGDDIITKRGKLGFEMIKLELNATTVITRDLIVDEVPKSYNCSGDILPHLLTVKMLSVSINTDIGFRSVFV